jgi:hypothetical protein
MARQGDIFSNYHSNNLRTAGDAAGISMQRQNAAIEQLLQNEMKLLGVKKKIFDLDQKGANLFKNMSKMMKDTHKKHDIYQKSKKAEVNMVKELKKLEELRDKERAKGLRGSAEMVELLEQQTKQQEFQLRLARLQNDQMRRSLPMGGKLAGVYGGINSSVKAAAFGVATLGVAVNSIFDLILAPIKLIGQLLTAPLNKFLEIQKVTGNIAADLGLTNAETYKFKRDFATLAIHAVDMGGTMQDVATAMKIFSDETNRNPLFSKGNIDGLVRLAYATGVGVEGASQILSMYQNMGLGFEQGIELTESARSVAAKYNLNSTKLLQNLGAFTKQLGSYELKNGLKGLESVVAKAQTLRFSLDNIGTIADKLFDPEGVVEASAQLNVLGGRFAQLGNFWELAFDAQNAPEQIADKMMNAVRGMARKRADGSFFISPADRKMISLAASAVGESADNLMNAAIEYAKLDDKLASNPLLKKGLLSEADRMALGNLAQMRDGKVMIRMPEGYETLLSSISSKSELERIVKERAKNETAHRDRRNWSERLNAMMERFLIGFTQPFARIDGIFNDTKLWEKIENMGTTLADKFIPLVDELFAGEGKFFKFVSLLSGTIGKVMDDVVKILNDPNRSILGAIKDGIGQLFRGLVNEVMPYFQFGFGKMFETVGQALPMGMGDSMMRAGIAMQAKAISSTPALASMLGQSSVNTLIGRANSEAAMADSNNNLLTRVGSSIFNLLSAAGKTSTGDFLGGWTDLKLSGAQFVDGIGGLFDWKGTDNGFGDWIGNGESLEASVRRNNGLSTHYNPIKVEDGLVTSSGQVVKYPKGELLAVLAPQQQMSGGGNGKMELSGTIRLETPAGATNLTMDDFKRLGLHAIAATITHEQNKTEKGYGLNDSKDIKTRLAI